jgi:hypothetical protein
MVYNTDKFYDIVTKCTDIHYKKKIKFSKNQQNEIRNFLLHNKLILETSKQFYNISLKELQVN